MDRDPEFSMDGFHPTEILHSSFRQRKNVDAERDVIMEPILFRRRVHRPRIPLFIRFGTSESSSLPILEEETTSPKSKSSRDSPTHNNDNNDPSLMCLKLLESDCYEDYRLGIEQLVVIVNRDLVNSNMEGSVAQSLILGTEGSDFSKRIRAIFPSFCTDAFLQPTSSRSYRVGIRHDHTPFPKETETRESESTDETSLYSDLSNSTGKPYRHSMKLPALRVFVSSLELLAQHGKKQTLNLSEPFWKCMLAYMLDNLEVDNIEPIESALCIKGFRLLQKLDTATIQPLVKEKVLPYLNLAKEHGQSMGDKMLVRECDRLLRSCIL